MEESNKEELSDLVRGILKNAAKNPQQVKIITTGNKSNKLTPEQIYHKRVSALITLLTPIVVIPQEGGEGVYTKYILENSMYRDQVEDWLMHETKKYFKFGAKK